MSGYTIISQFLMSLKAKMEVYGKTVTGFGPLMTHRHCGVLYNSRALCVAPATERSIIGENCFRFPPPPCVRLFAFNHLSKSVLFVGHRQTV